MAKFHLGVPLGSVGISRWQTALTDDLWLRLFLLCLLDEIRPCVIFRWAASTSAQSHWRWGERREREFGPSILTKYRLVHHCDFFCPFQMFKFIPKAAIWLKLGEVPFVFCPVILYFLCRLWTTIPLYLFLYRSSWSELRGHELPIWTKRNIWCPQI